MSNDDAEKIRQLEEQLEAARAQARVQALEQELAALKSQDAQEAESAQLAAQQAEAAQAEAERAEAAQAAALEAEATAQQAREAQLAREAELAREVEAANAALAAQAAMAAPAPAPAFAPAATPAPAPKAKKGGLVATLVILLVLLVAALAALFLALRGDLRLPGAAPSAVPTELVLIDAASFGPAPAKLDSNPLITFDALSSPATASAPEPGTAVSISQVAGDSPEIYGQSFAPCQTINSGENDGATAAFLAALNADETLGLDQPLTTATEATYFQQITYGHLLADTRVTYNGYSAGANFPIQAVLQKGTLVGFDRYGMPRVHCGSAVPLTAPVLAEGETKFSGSAWEDFDAAKLVELTPAASAQSAFSVLPVGPANTDVAYSTGPRQCTWSAPAACPAPTDLTEVAWPGDSVTEGPAPSPTTCSVWAPGTTDDDAVSTRFVNATDKTIQGFMVQSAEEGCGVRFDVSLNPGENLNLSTYWPGTIMVFTDGTTATAQAEYTFGERTLFVVR